MEPVQPLPWRPDPRRGPGLYDANSQPVSFIRNAAFIEHMALHFAALEGLARTVARVGAGVTEPQTVQSLGLFAMAIVQQLDAPKLETPAVSKLPAPVPA